MHWLLTSVRLLSIRSYNQRGTAQPAVVIDNRPATPWLRNIDSPSKSAQQTICLDWHVKRKARLRVSFLSQWIYSCYTVRNRLKLAIRTKTETGYTTWYYPSSAIYVQDVFETRSSAVAERPRDASCLSVSFNSTLSTIPRAHSSIISYFGFRFTTSYTIKCCSVVFGVSYVEASCHKHFVDVSRHHQTSPLTATGMSVTNLPRSGGTVFVTPEARHWSKIAIFHIQSAFDAPVKRVPVRILP